MSAFGVSFEGHNMAFMVFFGNEKLTLLRRKANEFNDLLSQPYRLPIGCDRYPIHLRKSIKSYNICGIHILLFENLLDTIYKKKSW